MRSNAAARTGRSCAACLALATAISVLAGCEAGRTEAFLEAQREAQALREQVNQLETQLTAEQQTVRGLQKRLATMRGMEPDLLDQLITPVRIELAGQSGTYTTPGAPEDTGIVLYVQPMDEDGHVIKAAGSFLVTLLDLSDPSNPSAVATYEFDVPTTRELWFGRFLTNHFTLRCPWPPSGPPPIDEITARIEFTVLLTGQVLIAQERFEIKRPPVVTAPAP